MHLTLLVTLTVQSNSPPGLGGLQPAAWLLQLLGCRLLGAVLALAVLLLLARAGVGTKGRPAWVVRGVQTVT